MAKDGQMTVDEILRGAGAVHYNLSTAALVEHAIRRGEGKLAANGAFVAETGKYTGRSPKDKFVVREPWSEQNVAWGPVNQPIEQEKFDALVARVVEYLRGKELFVFEGAAGANPKHQIRVRAVTELAWTSDAADGLLCGRLGGCPIL